jgi:signal transduction histidine kinase
LEVANKLVVGLVCSAAIIHAFVNYRLIPSLNKGFVSWHYQLKHLIFIILDFFFVSVAMVFSGGITSPYFFIYFLPLIVGSIILPPIYLIVQVIIIYLCYLSVRFYTIGFWPIFDYNLLLAFSSVALVAFLVSKTGGEEKRAREKAQTLASQLQEANVKLQELDKMKDEFLAIASHELRTPMAAIKGFISLVLSGEAGKLEPQSKDYLRQAYQGNERLIKLISDLLSVSRIESGRAEYMMMEFDPQEIVEDVIGELEPEARHKELFLRQKRLPFKVYVKGDPEKLKEVIFNLLSNGIKFTDHGGVELTYEVSDSKLTVRVTDTGEGIDEKSQDLIFKKFQQLGPLLKRRPGGTGLGLYIARRYLEAMGGKIWLQESEVGKGSTFAFQLPCRHSEDLSKLYEPVKMDEKAKRFFLVKEKSN